MTRAEAIKCLYDIKDSMPFDSCNDWIDACYIAIKSLSADVRENVKGEWIYLGLDVAGEYMYQCSHCKAIIYEPEFLINYDKAQLLGNRFNYCPNCGADMRSRLRGTEIDGMYIDISGDGTVIERI